MADRLLRISEVADRLGYDRSHTYAMIRQGRFPVPVIREFGQLRVSEKALTRWMERAGRPAVPTVAPPVVKAAVSPRRRKAQPAKPAAELTWPTPQW